MASTHNFQQNLPKISQPQSNPENKHFAWEPYAISTPRKLITEQEIQQQKREKKIDQDFIDAYLTYSPYRTSNQEYGAKKPNIHYINRQETNPMNDLSQDSRNVFSSYSSSTNSGSTTSKTGFP